MIHFDLVCGQQHTFDGWFRNGDDFDDQVRAGLLQCPICGDNAAKALMAPAVATRAHDLRSLDARASLRQAIALAEDVGDNFAREVRAMEENPDLQRGVYGRATNEEIRDLIDDGIDVYEMPMEPEPN